MIILTFLTGIDGTVGAFKACLADVGTSIIMHGYLVTSSVLQKLGWRWLILQTTYISCTSRCSVAVASSDKKWNVFLRKIIFTPRFPSVHSFHSVFPFLEMSWDVEFGSWDPTGDLGGSWPCLERMPWRTFSNTFFETSWVWSKRTWMPAAPLCLFDWKWWHVA